MNTGDRVKVLSGWRLSRNREIWRLWTVGKIISSERQTPEGIIYHWAEIYPPPVEG